MCENKNYDEETIGMIETFSPIRIEKKEPKIHDKILRILKSYSSIIDFDEPKEAFNLLADLTELFKEQPSKSILDCEGYHVEAI